MSSIVVTHEIHSAATISDRVALLDQGRIVFDDTFEALKQSKDAFVSKFVQNG
jgi:phospholipid/cholesterol/gamma-HCH transport system ATP-binding protein